MYKTIKDVLENTATNHGDKIAFQEPMREITYRDFYSSCQRGATYLLDKNLFQKNVLIFIDKSINCLEAMFSCACAGAIYTVVDVTSPSNRIELIMDTLKPECIITDEKNLKKCNNMGIPIYEIEKMQSYDSDVEKVAAINEQLVGTDPLYILFTSGSTGIPKGSVISHSSTISYAKDIAKIFSIDETTIFGSQTPLYFSMSILDVYTSILKGSTYNIIPKMYFSFPVKLVEHMNTYRINTIYWVPSALAIVANLGTFEAAKPEYLRTVLFAGETMPTKVLNVWRKYLPDITYANLFGPTEITDTGTYYIVDREFADTDPLPIGIPFPNADVLVIDEDMKEVSKGEQGELLFRGPFVGLGYYNNPSKTRESFIQNPLNDSYPETVYRTGDLVKYNEKGELMYLGRKDFQIKHMGYRIELGEIESNIFAIAGVLSCACIYDAEKSAIVLFYQSNTISCEEMQSECKKRLLPYMVPNKIHQLVTMPMNQNGKIDRVKLKEMEK